MHVLFQHIQTNTNSDYILCRCKERINIKMRVDIPELKKCCFCLPLRRSLIACSYLKLIVEILQAIFIFRVLIKMGYVISFERAVGSYIVVSTALLVLLVDIVFCILFLVSAHRKRYENMRITYRYEIIMLSLGAIGLVMLIGYEIYIAVISMPYTVMFLNFMLEVTSVGFIILVFKGYFIILVRSEILKLERSDHFEFINHTSEPECKAQITV